MLKNKKPLLLITLGAAVLLIGGTLTAYFLLRQRTVFLGDAPVGSQLVPQDALVTASISTDSAQWQQLRQYGTPETQAAFDKQLTQMRDEFLTANGYNYEQDIKPWLGKTVMTAYLASRVPTAGTTQGQASPLGIPFLRQPDILVLPIDNPTQVRRLLDKPKSQQATPLVERTYKGIQIRETQRSKAQNYSATVLGRFVVVTNNPKTTDRVIDTYKGADSVAATPGYIEQLKKIKAQTPFAQVYLNMPVFAADLAANSKRSLSPDQIMTGQQRQGVAATVSLEPQGMRFQGISWLKPNSTQKNEIENPTSPLPRRLPANTLLMISGSNLSRLWQDYAQTAESNPLALIPPVNITEGLKGALGMSLEENFLPWMGSEFTLALLPAPPEALTLPGNQQSPPLGAGVVLMVQASDRARAEQSLKQLDEVMATRYRFQVQQTQVGGQPVVSWTSPLAGVSGTHGWLEGNVVFLTLGAPIASAIVPQPQATLPQSQLFQQTVPTQPNPNNGHFFLDVERTINSGTMNLQQLFPPEQKMLAKAINAIGVTSAVSDKQSNRFDLFVQVKTTPAPNASPSSEPSVSPSISPSLPETSKTPASSPSLSQTPQTPASSPSLSQTPQTPASSPLVSPTPQIPASSPSVSQTPPGSPSP
ncbi:MAG TPA: hypothetical protein DCP31_02955 [Cyanobacteria bacterium UBA8543]|nr:hypothetical protein [Cyanobacteria bacterium UBA8543]